MPEQDSRKENKIEKSINVVPFLGVTEKMFLDKYLVKKPPYAGDSRERFGIYEGSMTVIRGNPGTGTELFAYLFANADRVENSIYFITHSPMQTVQHSLQMSNLLSNTIDINDDIYRRKSEEFKKQSDMKQLKIEGISVTDLLKLDDKEDEEGERKGKANYFYDIISTVKDDTNKNKRIVVDNLDFFLNMYDAKEVMNELETLKVYAYENNETVLMLMANYPENHSLIRGIDDLSDIVIELERRIVGSEYQNVLSVKKIGGRPPVREILEYGYEDGQITMHIVERIM